jgi:hypothetical protein
MLWDLYQQYRIGQLDRDLKDVRFEKTADELARSESRRLEEKLDKLALICRAMFEILQEKGGISDKELSAKVTEIDLRDGQADGRVAPPPPKTCPKCQAAISPKFGRCLFCGYRDDSVASFT